MKGKSIYENKTYSDVFLTDIIETLSQEKDSDKKKNTKDIISILEQYATGSFSRMFNGKTNVTIDDRNIIFLLS
jgi:hypothetical protein